MGRDSVLGTTNSDNIGEGVDMQIPSADIVFSKEEIFDKALEALKEKYGENF